MKSFILILVLCSMPYLEAKTPDTDWVVEQLKEVDKGATVDTFLEKFPKEWFQNYSIFYHSRSLQGGSMERPRVVSARPNRNFVFSFRAPDRGDAQETLEIIETDGSQSPAQFTEITFDRTGKNLPKVVRNPSKCLSCHGFGSNSKEAGFIWDHYPQNIGAFGSAHNGYLYSTNPPTGGQSKIPTPEFEAAAIKLFQETAENRPYYRHLQNLKSRTYDDFGIENFNFYSDFQAFHILRFWEKYFAKKPSFQEASDFFINSWLAGSPLAQQTEIHKKLQENLGGFYSTLKAECNELMAEDLERTKAIYDLYGTENDKVLSKTFQVMPPKGSYGLISYCYYGYNSSGDENNFSPVQRALLQYVLSGNSSAPDVFISTDFFRKNAYITSGGYPLLFLQPEMVEGYLGGSKFGREGYSFNELPRSARQMALTVPSFYRQFRYEEIKTIEKLAEVSKRLESVLLVRLEKMKDVTAKEYFTPALFPGFSDDFWKKLESLN